jgi:hypothetical protein
MPMHHADPHQSGDRARRVAVNPEEMGNLLGFLAFIATAVPIAWGKQWWRGEDLNLRPSGYEPADRSPKPAPRLRFSRRQMLCTDSTPGPPSRAHAAAGPTRQVLGGSGWERNPYFPTWRLARRSVAQDPGHRLRTSLGDGPGTHRNIAATRSAWPEHHPHGPLWLFQPASPCLQSSSHVCLWSRKPWRV